MSLVFKGRVGRLAPTLRLLRVTLLVGLMVFLFALFVADRQPSSLEIGTQGVEIATIASLDWDKVCFFPQFSYPEIENGDDDYAYCRTWKMVEERNVLMVFSGGGSCESFGLVGDFLAIDYDEIKCFSYSEAREMRLLDYSGIIKLEN